MPVARRPIYFVMAKRWLTLDWSSNLSCHIHTRTNHWARSKFCVSYKRTEKLKEVPKYTLFCKHTGTFFWVTKHTESVPRTPIEVIPAAFTALKAYSEPRPQKTHRTKQSGGSSRERDPAGTQTDRDGQENKRWDGQQNNNHIPTWYKRPSGEKMVMWRSYPAPDPLLMVSKPSMLLSLLFSSLLYSSSSASSSRVVPVLFSQLLSSKTVPRNPNS